MEIIGYILAIFIGVSLGLLGSGGSILTVPLLVYFFGIEPTLATSYSLLIVGAISGVGSIIRLKNGQVNLRIVGIIGISSMVTVLLTRMYLLPAVPEKLLLIGSFSFNKSNAIMILLAILLFGSGYHVLKGPMNLIKDHPNKPSPVTLLIVGIGIGLITGFLGAGGGFLIVPALMLLFRTPIHVATGTSLALITINMLLGSLGDVGRFPLDWNMVLLLLGITLGGLILGQYLSSRINTENLSKGFGWFLLIMSIIIMMMEIGNIV